MKTRVILNKEVNYMKKSIPFLLLILLVSGCRHAPQIELTEISVTANPKTEYTVGEKIDYTGLEVTAKYSDETTKIIQDYIIEPDEGTELSECGTFTATVTAGDIKTTFDYTVVKYFDSLSVKNDIETYYVGDIFNYKDLIVTANYSDGSTSKVEDYECTVEDNSEFTEAGVKTITITYAGKTADIEITVKELSLSIKEIMPTYSSTVELYSEAIDDLLEMKVEATVQGHGTVTFDWYMANKNGSGKEKMISESFSIEDGNAYTSTQKPKASPYLQTEYYCIVTESNGSTKVEKVGNKVGVDYVLPELGLPLLNITTVNNEMPTCERIQPPSGCWGWGITNETKVPGKLVITDKENVEYNSDEYDGDKKGMTIKIRGNTSAYGKKNPYKIKLMKKANLLNDGNDDNKNKNWLLLTTATSLNTVIGLKTTELVFDPAILDCDNTTFYVPEYRFVNVMINNEFKGIYLLIEDISDSDGRIQIDDTGYIIERDAYWWNEDMYFDGDKDSFYPMAWTFKYPNTSDFKQSDYIYTYIQNYITETDASVIDGTYENYIDVNSFAKWMLAHDILGNLDGAGSNIYCVKYDNTDATKLKMTTLWDFDAIMQMNDSWDSIHNASWFYYNSLFNSSNRAFIEKYQSRWNEISNTISNDIISFLNTNLSSICDDIDLSRKVDAKRWNTNFNTVQQNISTAQSWFSTRKTWLDIEIPKL